MTHRPFRWAAAAGAAPLVVGLVLAGATAGSADEDVSTGQWYYDAFHIQDAQDAGLTGAGVTIAIIDSPVNLDVPALANSRVEVREPSFCLDSSGTPFPATSNATSGELDALHGTDVALMLAGTGDGYPGQEGVRGIAPGATVLYYAANVADVVAGGSATTCRQADDGQRGVERAMAAAMNEAIDAGADIISISSATNQTTPVVEAVARAHREGVLVVAAVPNEQLSLTGAWPGAANGVVAVQAVDAAGTPISEDVGGLLIPNGFSWTTVAGPGIGVLSQGSGTTGLWETQELATGTSYATPVIAGFLALVKQKYPDATANQLIQTLIHNTGVDEHELLFDDEIGYGIASVTHMLAVDPAQYPDENPLLTEDGRPTAEDIAAAPTPSAAPGAPGASDGFPWPAVIVGGAVGLLVLIGIIVLIIVLATRSARASGRK